MPRRAAPRSTIAGARAAAASTVAAIIAAIIVLGALAGCPPPRYVRAYPRWVLDGGRDLRFGCAIADAFVRKSGKEGVGLTVELRSITDCDVRITRAALVFADGARADAAPPAAPAPLRGRSLVYAWLPIAFDGDRAWNRGVRAAALELELTVAGATHAWRIPATLREGDAFDDRAAWREGAP